MEEHGVGHLPVLDYEKVIGTVSERDVLRCPWAQEGPVEPGADVPAEEQQVGHWVTEGVVSLGPGDDVRTAAARMLGHQVRGLPIVTEKGGLMALITAADLVWHLGRRRALGDEEGFTPVVELMTRDPMAVVPEPRNKSSTISFCLL